MKIRDHLLLIVLIPAVILIGVISYNRFMVNHDYLVTYEGDCDPETQDCYVGCEDDECTEEYYYSLIEKYAADVYNQCGPDISDCDSAYICLPSDSACIITYCDPETEGDACEYVTGTELSGEPEEEGSEVESEAGEGEITDIIESELEIEEVPQ